MKHALAALGATIVLAGVASATPTGFRSLLIEPGVVASGMGYAYTAVADEPSALYWNPAGLTRGGEGYDFLLTHTEWFVDQRMEYFAGRWNRGADAFGAGVSGFYLGGIERRDDYPTSEPLGDFASYDIVVSLAYARAQGPFRAGITAKPFYTKIDRESAHGVAVDLGAQYDTPVRGLVLGGAVANLGNRPYYISERFSLPVDVRGGAAYRLPFTAGEMPVEVVFAAEVRKSRGEDTHTHAGVDIRLRDAASVRFGYKWGYELEDFSFGIGVRRGPFAVDYALVPFQSDFGTVHRFGVTLHRNTL